MRYSREIVFVRLLQTRWNADRKVNKMSLLEMRLGIYKQGNTYLKKPYEACIASKLNLHVSSVLSPKFHTSEWTPPLKVGVVGTLKRPASLIFWFCLDCGSCMLSTEHIFLT